MRTESPPWTWEEVGSGDHLNDRERGAITTLLQNALELNAGVSTSQGTSEDGHLVFNATVALVGEIPVAFVMRDNHDVIVAVAKR